MGGVQSGPHSLGEDHVGRDALWVQERLRHKLNRLILASDKTVDDASAESHSLGHFSGETVSRVTTMYTSVKASPDVWKLSFVFGKPLTRNSIRVQWEESQLMGPIDPDEKFANESAELFCTSVTLEDTTS